MRLLNNIYKNRKYIFSFIFMILLFMGTLQILNKNAKEENERNIKVIQEQRNQKVNTNDKWNETKNQTNSNILDNVDNSYQSLNSEQMIKLFIGYCNERNYEKAYELLSENNKKEKYDNINKFQEWISNIFYENRECSITIINYISSLYQVEVFDDVLSTGEWKKNNLKIVNIKVVEEENLKRLELEEKIEN